MSQETLVVDLDGTLIRSDMLFETFWSALSRSWMAPIHGIKSIFLGRGVLKSRLAELGPVNISSLPYNPDVIRYIRNWRAKGGSCVLVTAADQKLAGQVAEHLGLFDEVHGSSPDINLKGHHKAAFLEGRFGDRGFAYIGDAQADVPIWEKSSHAIVVGHSDTFVQRLARLGGKIDHIDTPGPMLRTYARALRPHQWVKNLLVFLPIFAAHAWAMENFFVALLTFIAFSLIASAGYVFNDLLDLEADRAHPNKCRRPFASGEIPIAHGTFLAPGLLVAGLLVALPLGEKPLGLLVVYFALTMLYSLHLKRQIMIDVCVLACLYTLRIVTGGIALGIPLSVWLLAFSIFFFLSLAVVKRQSELVAKMRKGEEDVAGRGYRASDLPLITGMALASGYISILVMALYMLSPDVLVLYHQPAALWGFCLILLYWISRMVMISHRGEMHDDPIVFAARDRASQISLLLMIGCMVGASI